jgi:hypothetical protein
MHYMEAFLRLEILPLTVSLEDLLEQGALSLLSY